MAQAHAPVVGTGVTDLMGREPAVGSDVSHLMGAPSRTPRSGQAPKPQPRIGPAPSRWWDLEHNVLGNVGFMAGAETGGTLGGELAAPLGPEMIPVGVALGGLAGGMWGAGGAEAAQVGLERLSRALGIGDRGLRAVTAAGAAQRIGQAGQSAAEAETIGRGAAPVLEKAARPFASRLEEYARDAMELFRRPERPAAGVRRLTDVILPRGINAAVLPSEVSKSRVLGIAENIAEGSLVGGGVSSDVREARQKIAEQKVMGVLSDLGEPATRREAGQAVQRALPTAPRAEADRALQTATEATQRRQADREATRQGVRQTAEEAARMTREALPTATPVQAGQTARVARAAAIKGFRGQEREAWQRFEQEASHIPMDAPKTLAFIGTLPEAERGRILPHAGVQAAQGVERVLGAEPEAPEPLALRSPSGKALPVNVEKLPAEVRRLIAEASGQTEEKPVTVVQFQKTVSDLGRLTRALEKSAQSDPAKYNAQLGLARKLYATAREDMADVLTKTSPAARQAYDDAVGLSRLGNERLFNAEVLRVTRQNPERVTQTLLKPNNSTAIKLTTDAIGDAAMQPIRRVAIDQILQPDPATGAIDWLKASTKLHALGDDTLSALFPKGEAKGLQAVAESVARADRLLTEEAKVDAAALREARSTITRTQKLATAHDVYAPLRDTRTPERILNKLFRKENVTAVEAVRGQLGQAQFQPVQRAAMDMMVDASRDVKTGHLSWGRLARHLTSIDPETLRAFYPGGQADQILHIAQTMARMERTPAGGIGRVAIMLEQWGVARQIPTALAVTGLATGALTGRVAPAVAGVGFLLTPGLISQMFANPRMLRWLTVGFDAPPWSRQAIAASSYLTMMLRQQAQRDAQAKAGGQ